MSAQELAGLRAGSKPSVILSSPAAQALRARRISRSALMNALAHGTSRRDASSGREIIRSGDLRVVVERDDDRITVITAMHVDDLAD